MKRLALSVMLAGIVIGAWAGVRAQDQESSLPEGEGKALVVRMCSTSCHSISTVIEVRQSEEDWAEVVGDMVGMGAEGTPEEQKIVAAYLGKYFGRPQKPAPAPAQAPDSPAAP